MEFIVIPPDSKYGKEYTVVIAHTKSFSHQKRKKKQIGSHIGWPQNILFCFVGLDYSIDQDLDIKSVC